MPVFATILTILTLVFGGAGVTAAAAQSSLPDQPLYAIKLFTEQVRSDLTAGAQAQAQWALQISDRRGDEFDRLIAAGQTPSDQVLLRYQEQIDTALQLSAGLPSDQAQAALAQVRQQLESCQQTLAQLAQQNGDVTANGQLDRARTLVQERLRLLDMYSNDLPALQTQLRQQRQGVPPAPQNTPAGAGSPNRTNTIIAPELTGSESQATLTSPAGTASSGGGNPWTTGTPLPNSGYGPGPGPDYTPTCEPAEHDYDYQGTKAQPTHSDSGNPGEGQGGNEHEDTQLATPSSGSQNTGSGSGNTNKP